MSSEYSYKKINELSTINSSNLKNDDLFLVTTTESSEIDNELEYITKTIQT
jgi:hypothetical protein